MNKIFCLVGKSGSGKTTIIDKLKEDNFICCDNNLYALKYHTTRERRNDNDNEYWFDSEELYNKYAEQHIILEERSYDTINGIVHYYTLDNDIILDNHNYIVAASYDQYKNYCNVFGKDNVVMIYIYVDDKELLTRAINRCNKNSELTQICKRYINDSEDYKDLLVRPSDLVVNNNITTTAHKVKGIINQYL